MTTRRKLIEVAPPLEAINKAEARELRGGMEASLYKDYVLFML